MKLRGHLYAFASIVVCCGLALDSFNAYAQSRRAVVTVGEVREIARGYSARKEILDATVYDERGNAIGKVEDILISKGDLAYGVIDVGAYVGEPKRIVPLPVNRFLRKDGRIVLLGASRDELKRAPSL